ncbi:MAG: isochorismate lyase [Pseudobdellovibrionaceae bacterium]|nr:isochorismate lyase [Pseudobdellovibrionaceae bacterium]
MKKPHECTSLAEVRTAIDAIDRQIISALGQRFEFVKSAARFKSGEASVRAADRVHAMLRERRGWAQEHGLDPDVIEKIYRDLVAYFTEAELRHWQSKPVE